MSRRSPSARASRARRHDPGPLTMPPCSVSVPAESGGDRIDRFLASTLPGISRSQLQRLIRDGRVRLGSLEVKPNHLVREGEQIVVDIPEPVDPTPQPEALDLPILFDDGDLVVVDKPAGMV